MTFYTDAQIARHGFWAPILTLAWIGLWAMLLM